MFTYALCEFQYGYNGQFYQRNDELGNTVFFSLVGDILELIPPYGYYIVETDVTPPWV
jgi:predicted lipase